MKPGPAISTLAMPSDAGSAATKACASARGLVRAAFASVIATLVEKSPCERSFGRSTTKAGTSTSAGSVPAVRRAAIPWSTKARREVFTTGAEAGNDGPEVRRPDSLRDASHQPPCGHRQGRTVGDDEMVEQAHVHQVQRLFQP